MGRRLQYLVKVSVEHDQPLIAAGLVLAVISLPLYIHFTIILSNNFFSRNHSTNIELNNSSDIAAPSGSLTSSVQLFSSKTPEISSESYPLLCETYGFPLGNTLYYNLNSKCQNNGYISSVNCRLFNKWKDDTELLYLLVLSGWMLQHDITNRYATNPKKNTTE
ncbi:unnamed protein product [Rotaria socialis]